MKSALLASVLFLLACGSPEWIVTRPGISRPPRPSDCKVDFVDIGPRDVGPAGRYELLGYVILSKDAVQDPRDPATRDKVRSRACKLGGEAIALWDMKVSPSSPVSQTEIDYAVVRERQASPE